MRRLRIEHRTTYRFPVRVELEPHRLYLRPREGHDVQVESSRLAIHPPCEVLWQRDLHDNALAIARFLEPADTLSIESEIVIQHFECMPPFFPIDRAWTAYPCQVSNHEAISLSPHRIQAYPGDSPACLDWRARFWRPGQVIDTLALLAGINRAIASEFTYAERHAEGVQSPDVTLATRTGSCRDFATLFMETCRGLGLPARFVSGYLCTGSSAGPGGSTHAWTEVYLPGAGWRGYDSTLGEATGGSHIAVAVGRHPSAVPPVAGSFVGPAGLAPTLFVGVRTIIL
ncbi:MAG: transglutaminase family protein [Verrucomicrobiae bacterium]|nr:transglutaminase family protein [Verrucomicrobiae bacterium]